MGYELEALSRDEYLARVRVWALAGAGRFNSTIQEHAAQEVMMTADRRQCAHEAREGPAFWRTAGRNAAIDGVRRWKRGGGEPPREEEEFNPGETLNDPVRVCGPTEGTYTPEEFKPADDADLSDAVHEAIDALRGSEREVFRLYIYCGCLLHDIAEELSISVQTARTYLRSAMNKVRDAAVPGPTEAVDLTLADIGLSFLAPRRDLAVALPRVAVEKRRTYRDPRYAVAFAKVCAGELPSLSAGATSDDAARVAAHLGWRLLADRECWASEPPPADLKPTNGRQARNIWALSLVLALRTASDPADIWTQLQQRVTFRQGLRLEAIALNTPESVNLADRKHPLPIELVGAAQAFAGQLCHDDLFNL